LQTFVSAHGVPLVTGVELQPVSGLHVSVVHAFESLQLSAVPAVQVPLWQTSAPLQALPSVHDVPLATAEFTQPVVALHESVVQGFASLQEIALPAVQVPLWQVSAPLQRFPSRQGVPFGAGAVVQPVAGAHPSVVQGFESLQTSGVPAVHVPVWQVSGPLQRLPSVHDTPLATGVAVQPVAGLQVSVVHTFESLHTTGVPAVHTPA
jgi:hypothetical protein